MVRDVEVMMDMVVEVMVMVAHIGMIMVVVKTLMPWEWIVTMEDKELKQQANIITVQVEIVELNMVMDLVVEHIIIDYLGHWHCLLVLLWTCQKGKGNGKHACAAPL
jgi:hypothetical protein